jgi:hypothetical protein
MRKLALVITALSVLMASFVSPIGALAASSTHSPRLPGPHSGARTSLSPVHVPSTRLPSTSTSVSPVNCDAGFHFVGSPNGSGANFLVATAAISANDVWAIGNSTIAGPFDQTLAEHWDGTTWSIVPTPNPGSTDNDLNGVAAISSNDVWVVGNYFDSLIGAWLEFAAHWNGSNWTTTIFNYGFLFGVTALASNNVWAVGTTFFSPFTTVILHWDGSTWSVVTSQSPAAYDNELFAISAFSSTDIWAVGEQESVASGPLQSLAEHWNGTAWTTITTPNLGAGADNEIFGVNALEAGHAVGVGSGNFVSGSTPKQGEAWDLLASGSSTSAPESGPGPGDNLLNDVTRSAGSVWAVGYSRASASSAPQTLVIPATWDSTAHGLTWSPVGTSDSPSAINNDLFAVSAVSPYSYWAVGFDASAANVDQTLTESYCARNFTLTGPGSTPATAAFSVTVTVKNGNGTTATAYGGTVHFTSSDGSATLPAAYMFVPGDNGSHTFTGVVLRTAGSQTITVADAVMPLTVPASATIMVCLGACQAPAGTSGGRSANPGPAGTPGARAGVNQSGAGTPGPRLPRMGPVAPVGDSARVVGLATATGLESQVGNVAGNAVSTAPQSAAVPHTSGLVGSGTISASVQAPAQDKVLLAARHERVLPPPDQSLWYVLPLIPLLVCLLALGELRRRRFKEESNVRIRP